MYQTTVGQIRSKAFVLCRDEVVLFKGLTILIHNIYAKMLTLEGMEDKTEVKNRIIEETEKLY